MATKTLLLVHGFLGSSLNWGPLVNLLRKDPELADWDYASVDLLGHGGRSPFRAQSSEPLSLKTMGEDLLEQLPIATPLYVLGHSFGIRPLLWIAERYPEKFAGLIAEDTSPLISQSSYQFIQRVLTSVPVPFASRDLARETLKTLFADDPKLAAFLLTNIRPQPDGTFSWRFDREAMVHLFEEAYQQPLWKAWETYPGPIHLIRGEHSTFLSAQTAQECLARRVGLATFLYQIDQSGHWVHSDQLNAFVQTLSQILKVIK